MSLVRRLLLVGTGALVAATLPAHAAEAPAAGITVTPSIVFLDLRTDAPEVVLQYRNTTKAAVELRFSAQDFAELEDGWRVRLLDPPDAAEYRYGLTSWLHFTTAALILGPTEARSLTVRVSPAGLSPGAHYASILAEVSQPETARERTVGVRGILSSLLFVRTATGTETEEGSIREFVPVRGLGSFPHQFVLRFENRGNTTLVPHGRVEVFDPLGRLVAVGIVNEPGLATLPETIRRYEVMVRPQGVFSLPGRYRATARLRFGNNDKTVRADTAFVALGDPAVVVLLLVAIAAAAGVAVRAWSRGRPKRTT